MMQTGILKLHDYVAWLKLWQAYLTKHQAELSHDTTLNTWKYILSEDENDIIGIGVYEGDALKGFAHLVFHHNTWDARDCCYLEDLHVIEDEAEVAREEALIAAVTQLAKQRNCCRVYWHTSQPNPSTHELYKQLAKQTDFIKFTIDL